MYSIYSFSCISPPSQSVYLALARPLCAIEYASPKINVKKRKIHDKFNKSVVTMNLNCIDGHTICTGIEDRNVLWWHKNQCRRNSDAGSHQSIELNE